METNQIQTTAGRNPGGQTRAMRRMLTYAAVIAVFGLFQAGLPVVGTAPPAQAQTTHPPQIVSSPVIGMVVSDWGDKTMTGVVEVSPASAFVEVSESTPNLEASIIHETIMFDSGPLTLNVLKVTINKNVNPGEYPVILTVTYGSLSISETIYVIVASDSTHLENTLGFGSIFTGLQNMSIKAPSSSNMQFEVSPASAFVEVSESTPNLEASITTGSGASRTLNVTTNESTPLGSHPVTVRAYYEDFSFPVYEPFPYTYTYDSYTSETIYVTVSTDSTPHSDSTPDLEISGLSNMSIEAPGSGNRVGRQSFQVSPSSAQVQVESEVEAWVTGTGGSRTLNVDIPAGTRAGRYEVGLVASYGSSFTSETIYVTVTPDSTPPSDSTTGTVPPDQTQIAQGQTGWYVNDRPDLWHGDDQGYPGQDNWFIGQAGEGYGDNNYTYTYAIGGEGSYENRAIWEMERRVGTQEVQVYVPGNNATAEVDYTIIRRGFAGGGITRRIDQSQHEGWVGLGSFVFDNAEVFIWVSDNDVEQHWERDGLSRSSIGIDAIRMRCVSNCTSDSTPPSDSTPDLEISGLSNMSIEAPRSGTKFKNQFFQVSTSSARISISESTANLWARVAGTGESRTLNITINPNTRPGRYPVSLTATYGSSSTSKTVYVTVTPTPNLEISGLSNMTIEAPRSGTKTGYRTFQVSSSFAQVRSSESTPYLLAWITGSGESKRLSVTITKSTRPGRHPVRLIATEGSSSASETIYVTVTSASAPDLEVSAPSSVSIEAPQSANKKYRIEDECYRRAFFVCIGSRSRIYALQDITDRVGEGGKGGIVKNEDNLSSSGNSWIADGAAVASDGEKVRIEGNALVSGNARISGEARVYGNAEVSGNAKVSGEARVYGNAKVSGNARISGDAIVRGEARLISGTISEGVYDGESEYRSLAKDTYEKVYEELYERFSKCSRFNDRDIREIISGLLIPGSDYGAFAEAVNFGCSQLSLIRRIVKSFTPGGMDLVADLALKLLPVAKLPKTIHLLVTLTSAINDINTLINAGVGIKTESQAMQHIADITGYFNRARQELQRSKNLR